MAEASRVSMAPVGDAAYMTSRTSGTLMLCGVLVLLTGLNSTTGSELPSVIVPPLIGAIVGAPLPPAAGVTAVGPHAATKAANAAAAPVRFRKSRRDQPSRKRANRASSSAFGPS